MAKIPAGTKGYIVKLYKAGSDIDEIQKKAKASYPKITKSSIRSVICKHLMNLADELWSTVVKVKFGWKCAVSNKTDNLESHHLIRRGNLTHRWSIDNGICLNSYYHTLGGDIAAHGATDVTERFRDWMMKIHKKQWAWFEEHRNDLSQKLGIDELLNIVRVLEGEAKNGYHIETEELGKRKKVEQGSSGM